MRGDTVCDALDRLAFDADGLIHMREELAAYYRGRTRAELEACFDHLVFAPGASDAFKLFAQHGITTAIVTLSWEFGAEWLAHVARGIDGAARPRGGRRRGRRGFVAGRREIAHRIVST